MTGKGNFVEKVFPELGRGKGSGTVRGFWISGSDSVKGKVQAQEGSSACVEDTSDNVVAEVQGKVGFVGGSERQGEGQQDGVRQALLLHGLHDSSKDQQNLTFVGKKLEEDQQPELETSGGVGQKKESGDQVKGLKDVPATFGQYINKIKEDGGCLLGGCVETNNLKDVSFSFDEYISAVKRGGFKEPTKYVVTPSIGTPWNAPVSLCLETCCRNLLRRRHPWTVVANTSLGSVLALRLRMSSRRSKRSRGRSICRSRRCGRSWRRRWRWRMRRRRRS